jgi:hypothetical protein
VQKGKIRWIKVDGGERVVVLIQGGIASRENPNWSPKPEKLAYDLDKNRTLERAIKAAHLGGSQRGHEGANARTLEIDVLDQKGDWRPAGHWTMPVKTWQKGRFGAIFDLLDPLLSVKPELFDTREQKEPEPQ